MKKIVLVIALFLFVFMLTACNQKPKDVRQEIWDNGLQLTIYTNQLVNDEEDFPDGLTMKIGEINRTEKLTKAEKEIVKGVQELASSGIILRLALLVHKDEDQSDAQKSYDKAYDKLINIYGNSNLKDSNLDEKFVASITTDYEVEQVVAQESKSKKFMIEERISLTAKEVQYNMANNLDEKFFLDGEIELDDYYNYGFTNEEGFFCARVTPIDGNYSDSWYMYFNRKSFGGLYQRLLDDNVSYVRISAEIPSSVYEDGQDNMALVRRAEWE